MTHFGQWWQLTPTENSRITAQEREAGVTFIGPANHHVVSGPLLACARTFHETVYTFEAWDGEKSLTIEEVN